MANQRSRVADYTVYLLVRVLICIIQALSWGWALALARGLGWLAYRIDRRHRLIAAENVRHAFPDLDDQAVDRLVRASYLHLTTMLVEMVRPAGRNGRRAAGDGQRSEAVLGARVVDERDKPAGVRRRRGLGGGGRRQQSCNAEKDADDGCCREPHAWLYTHLVPPGSLTTP